MQPKPYRLFIGSQYQTGSLTANTAGLTAPSGLLEFTAPQGVRWGFTQRTLFQIKLLDGSSADLPRNSIITISHKVPGVPAQPLGEFPYAPFHDSALADQLDTQKQGALYVTLDSGVIVRGGESIYVQFTSSTALDPTNTENSGAFAFDVYEAR